MLQLFVRGVGTVTADSSSTVGVLLESLRADSLYYNGRLLDPGAPIGTIPNNASLDANMRLRGGMNPFKVLGEIFKLIIGMIKIVIKIVTLITKPAQCIMLILAFIIVSVLILVYFVLTLPINFYAMVAIWFFIMKIVPMIVYCLLFGVLLVAAFVMSILMTALNTFTGGSLKNIVLCDALPSAWHSVPNFHLKNRWERGGMCTRPCPARYAPNPSGSMCMVVPKGYPPYCPQAEAMRIFSSRKADGKYMFKRFDDTTNVLYLLKPPKEREAMLKDFYANRQKFAETCSANMSEYDNISLNICAAADSLHGVIDDREIAKLKAVCAQVYCTPQRNYPFCSKTSDLNDNDANAIIRKIAKIVTIVVIVGLTIALAMTFMYNEV